MKHSKVLFVIVFAIVAVVFALFEYGALPTALIPNSPKTTYAIDLAAMASSFCGCFALLYWFRIGPVRRHLLSAKSDAEASDICARHCNVRLYIWLILTLANIVLYYLAPQANNPKYCIIILCIAGIFCWPSQPSLKAAQTLDKADKAE